MTPGCHTKKKGQSPLIPVSDSIIPLTTESASIHALSVGNDGGGVGNGGANTRLEIRIDTHRERRTRHIPGETLQGKRRLIIEECILTGRVNLTSNIFDRAQCF